MTRLGRAIFLVPFLILMYLFITAFPTASATQPEPDISSENHSWEGYHLPRSSNPFIVRFGSNLDGRWAPHLRTTAADWSRSNVLDVAVVGGDGACDLSGGGVYDVCAEHYGATGWLGVAEARIDQNNHIVAGQVRLNSSYGYGAGEDLHVLCQEVGHILGLGHTSEDGSSQGTCMDYSTSGSTSDPSAHPNGHDYDQLAAIYAHSDGGGLPPVPTATRPPSAPTATPRPTATPTPRPATATPRPPTATPRPPAPTPVPPTDPPTGRPGVPAEMLPTECPFPETGFCTSPLFLDYWVNNGALRQQGFPISPIFYEVSPTNGQAYYVQYFERARFEYHPEAPREYVVLLGLLGREQFLAKYPNGVPADAILSTDAVAIFQADPAWGVLVHDHGAHAVYVRDVGNGERVITHVRKVKE